MNNQKIPSFVTNKNQLLCQFTKNGQKTNKQK